MYLRGLPLITYAPRGRGGGGSYIYIEYYMQKGGGGEREGVQIACQIAYVINGRPLTIACKLLSLLFRSSFVI